MIADACAFIAAEPRMPALATLAARAGLPAGRFLRLFRAETGLTPRSYAEGVHARRAAALPAGTGEALATLLLDCRFGRLLLAGTRRGVCYLGFGEPDPALLGDLRRRFPSAWLEGEPCLSGAGAGVLAYLAGGTLPDVPLDLRGTPFQLRVWAALRRIPHGETRSYTELAAMAGASHAVRAVARCCAVNPVSLLVPCHRILGRDGDLTGYRWGLGVKQDLQAMERRG